MVVKQIKTLGAVLSNETHLKVRTDWIHGHNVMIDNNIYFGCITYFIRYCSQFEIWTH